MDDRPNVRAQSLWTLRANMCRAFTVFGATECRACAAPCVYGMEYIRRIDKQKPRESQKPINPHANPKPGRFPLDDFNEIYNDWRTRKNLSHSDVSTMTGLSVNLLRKLSSGIVSWPAQKKLLPIMGMRIPSSKAEAHEMNRDALWRIHHRNQMREYNKAAYQAKKEREMMHP